MAQRNDTGLLSTERELGAVKWFNEAKGYGFIERDGGGVDLFVHYNDVEGTGYKTLKEGERVEFEVEEGSPGKKPKAARVRVIERAA
jgi:CspA family cold shock protein